jgi:hypothetical protein
MGKAEDNLMLVKGIDEITEKLAAAIETTGLKGGLAFNKIAVCESTKEGTGYSAYYSVAVTLPKSTKDYGRAFGKKINP